MNTGKILLGALAGVAAGAILGILFAPDKGTSTRRKITQKGDEYANGLSHKFNEFIEGITSKFETLKSDATHLVEKGKAKGEEMLADGTSAANAKLHQIRS